MTAVFAWLAGLKAMSSCQVKSEGEKKVVKWLEEPGFLASVSVAYIHVSTVSRSSLFLYIHVSDPVVVPMVEVDLNVSQSLSRGIDSILTLRNWRPYELAPTSSNLPLYHGQLLNGTTFQNPSQHPALQHHSRAGCSITPVCGLW